MEEKEKSTVDTGLADIPVCTSDISHTAVDRDGNPILLYRGYSIYDLVHASFEEVVYLLLNNKLPDKNELNEFGILLKENRILDESVIRHIRSYPKHVNMMDLLLTTFSFARMFDKNYENTLWQNPKADVQKLVYLIKDVGIRMGARIPTIIGYGYRILHGLNPIPPDDNLSFAGNALHMLGIEPEEEIVRVFDTSLILYLEHTINCSTFAALVTESSYVDPYGPHIAASVALKGVKHGGANEIGGKMFEEIKSPDNAEEYMLNKLKKDEIIIGFGHRLPHYKTGVESRVKIAEEMARKLAEKKGWGHLIEIYDIVTDVMMREKGLAQNLDLPISVLYKIIGIPSECNTPIFQASRHFGWVANMMRQRLNKGLLFRPTQVYTGPTLEGMKRYIPLKERNNL
jgi:citrate synthase